MLLDSTREHSAIPTRRTWALDQNIMRYYYHVDALNAFAETRCQLDSLEDSRTIQLCSYGVSTLLGIVPPVHPVPRDRTTGLLAFPAGVVPCTGSLLVLDFAIANDLYVDGLALILAPEWRLPRLQRIHKKGLSVAFSGREKSILTLFRWPVPAARTLS